MLFRSVFDKTFISENGTVLNLTYLEYEKAENRDYEKSEFEKLNRFIETYSKFVKSVYQEITDFCRNLSIVPSDVLIDSDGRVIDTRFPELAELQHKYATHDLNLYKIKNHFRYAGKKMSVDCENDLINMGFNPEWKSKAFGQITEHQIKIEIEPKFDNSPLSQYVVLKKYMIQAQNC